MRTLVEIVEPRPGLSIYDPTCGSGGMLIQTRDDVSECGGDPRDLPLLGHKSIGTTWSICKMNMLHDKATIIDNRLARLFRESSFVGMAVSAPEERPCFHEASQVLESEPVDDD